MNAEYFHGLIPFHSSPILNSFLSNKEGFLEKVKEIKKK